MSEEYKIARLTLIFMSLMFAAVLAVLAFAK